MYAARLLSVCPGSIQIDPDRLRSMLSETPSPPPLVFTVRRQLQHSDVKVKGEVLPECRVSISAKLSATQHSALCISSLVSFYMLTSLRLRLNFKLSAQIWCF